MGAQRPPFRRRGKASGASRRHRPRANRAAGPRRRVAEDRGGCASGSRAGANAASSRSPAARLWPPNRRGWWGRTTREPAEPDSLDALLADLVSAPRNDALIGRASFRRAPIVLIEDRVVLGSDRVTADHRAAPVAAHFSPRPVARPPRRRSLRAARAERRRRRSSRYVEPGFWEYGPPDRADRRSQQGR